MPVKQVDRKPDIELQTDSNLTADTRLVVDMVAIPKCSHIPTEEQDCIRFVPLGNWEVFKQMHVTKANAKIFAELLLKLIEK